MSKITKKQLQHSVDLLNKENNSQHKYLMRIKRALKSIDIDILSEEFDEPEPQLKQLDQSIFDGLEENWRFAAVDGCTGRAYVYEQKPHFFHGKDYWRIHEGLQRIIGHEYDTSNWQNSLIERDIAKELLEVDLSSELTGSDLARAMLARGDTRIMCEVYDDGNRNNLTHVIRAYSDDKFHTKANRWSHAIPINNQGEPLTASEAGF